ncbi:S9 family peptidase [Candidatus Dependentiae bacterium]
MCKIVSKSKISVLVYILFFVGFVGGISGQESGGADLIPMKVLFSKPEKTNIQISPDGKKIAYLAQCDGVYNIWVKTIGKDSKDIMMTDELDHDIKNYFWHKNSEHILYFYDKDGNGSCNLYMRDLATKEEINLTPFEGFIVGQVLAYSKESPDEVLITTKKVGAKYIDFDVCKVNIETGELSLLGVNNGNVISWFPDENNNLRAIKKLNEDGEYELFIESKKNDSGDDLQLIGVLEREDSPIGFLKDNKIFYVIDSCDSDTKKLVAINIVSGERSIVFEDPNYDISYAIFNPNTGVPEAAIIFKYRKEWVFFDSDFQNDMKLIRNLDYGDISLCSRSGDDTKWVIGFVKDNGPTSYWVFDRQTKEGHFLFFENAQLSQYEFVSVEPVRFASRDGLDIQGYITFPKGVERENLPLVLLVHGGPWGRNTWGFDPEVQWLVNRGYAVLQVNFRGSTGYGKSFLHAGDKQWGKKMQDDLLDAVQWAVEHKIADPNRICIYGFSYGGYAAIMGAALTPEKFCCAVDICGPKNLPDLVHEFASRFHHITRIFYDRVGDPQTDQELLKSASPVMYGDRINAPIFIVSGAHDFRVKKEDTAKIIEAIEKNNIEHENLFFEDEGHWITKECNKWKLYASLEKFLAKHLGG